MIRTVIDTNVFVSSFFGGKPRRVIDLWKNGQLLLCLSADIVDEYVAVLQRLGLDPQKEIDTLLQFFAKGYHIVFTTQTPTLNIVAEDPDDNKFLECAVALGAGFIVSGDKTLLAVKNYMHIKIRSPHDFLMTVDRGGV